MTFKINLEKETLKNKKFRKILYTTEELQLVLMNLFPYEEIGLEMHNATQFIRIEDGSGKAIVNNKYFILKEGDSITIDKHSQHNIIAGKNGLKLYTIYAPPQH